MKPNDSRPNKPSATSLHIEGLVLDIVGNGTQNDIQKKINQTHFGEREFSSDYTHIGLPTFSKSYLQRNNLDVYKFYRKLSDEGITMSDYEKSKILKTIDPRTWNVIPSHYDSKSNAATFGNYKPVNENQVFQDGGNTYNLNNIYKGSVQYNDYLPQYEKIFKTLLYLICRGKKYYQRVMQPH